jgi:hypothetical protein
MIFKGEMFIQKDLKIPNPPGCFDCVAVKMDRYNGAREIIDGGASEELDVICVK